MPTDQKPFDDATLQAMFAEQDSDDRTDPKWIAIKEACRRFEDVVRALFVDLNDEVPADLPAYRARVREVALAYAACINGAHGDVRSITQAVQSVHLSYMLATKGLAYQGRLRATLVADAMRENLAAALVAYAAISARRALEPTRQPTREDTMNLITPTEMHVDDVDSGLPLLTLDASGMGGPGPITYALSRDAVRGLVDALSGVAPVAPEEVRLTVKADLADVEECKALVGDAVGGVWCGSPASPTGLLELRSEAVRLRPEPPPRALTVDDAPHRLRLAGRGHWRTTRSLQRELHPGAIAQGAHVLAPMLGLGFDEECAEVMVARATRIPRLAVLLGCPAETVARGWTVQRPQPRGDGTWFPGAILAGHECKEWGTSLDVPEGTVGDSDRGLDVALNLLEAS